MHFRQNSPEPLAAKVWVVEYLRAFAALSVSWFHLTNQYAADWVRASGSYGWLGVEVFFIISGFVIPYSIAASYNNYHIKDFWRFFCKRAARLEPPYLISVVLAAALWWFSSLLPGFSGSPPPRDPWLYLAHVAYLIPLTPYQWLQPVYWTFGLRDRILHRLGIDLPFFDGPLGSVGLDCVCGVDGACRALGRPALPLSSLFVIGIAVFRSLTGDRLEKVLNAMLATTMFIVLLTQDVRVACVGATTATVIYSFSARRLNGRAHGVLIWLASISYSLYLTHVLFGGRIVNLGKRFAQGAPAELALSLFALACCIVFAAGFRWMVERPAHRLARSLGRAAPVAS